MKAIVNNRAVESFYKAAAFRRDMGRTTIPPERATAAAIHNDIVKQASARFDLQSQDTTMKYERPKFAVVGEGSRTAQDKYRTNYDLIDWRS